VFNMSETGFGAIVPTVKADWVQVGRLFGLRTETSETCRAGIIRRMTRDQYGQRRIGVEMPGTVAAPAQFARAGAAGALDPAARPHAGLLLSRRPDRKGEIEVLLRAGGYAHRQDLHMQVRGRTYLISPVDLVETGEDFDRARYKAVKEIGAA
jgi:hypothetical protein